MLHAVSGEAHQMRNTLVALALVGFRARGPRGGRDQRDPGRLEHLRRELRWRGLANRGRVRRAGEHGAGLGRHLELGAVGQHQQPTRVRSGHGARRRGRNRRVRRGLERIRHRPRSVVHRASRDGRDRLHQHGCALARQRRRHRHPVRRDADRGRRAHLRIRGWQRPVAGPRSGRDRRVRGARRHLGRLDLSWTTERRHRLHPVRRRHRNGHGNGNGDRNRHGDRNGNGHGDRNGNGDRNRHGDRNGNGNGDRHRNGNGNAVPRSPSGQRVQRQRDRLGRRHGVGRAAERRHRPDRSGRLRDRAGHHQLEHPLHLQRDERASTRATDGWSGASSSLARTRTCRRAPTSRSATPARTGTESGWSIRSRGSPTR